MAHSIVSKPLLLKNFNLHEILNYSAKFSNATGNRSVAANISKGLKLFNDKFVSKMSFTEPDFLMNDDFFIQGFVKVEMKKKVTYKPSVQIRTTCQCCVKGILGTGGVMDKCVQMWTRNYGALGQTARVCFGVLCANQTREVKRDFCDLPMRRNEGRVVNTPLVFKRVLFQERRGRKEKKRTKKETRERENGRKEVGRGERVESGRENGRKDKRERTEGVRDWSEKDDERQWR
ncbi:hypothetical protein TNCV_3531001 [Trichonephila clavipes]|uniref:Uncharacterized protein n=1 Tax=Trichonephila clavipes TaxID=2585209 RepID=A0A8X6SLR0_TRICX|nr:hypothetical protein TNCV_3531001 [Trichonephila clavipes]